MQQKRNLQNVLNQQILRMKKNHQSLQILQILSI